MGIILIDAKYLLLPLFVRKRQELSSMNEQYLQALSLYQR